MTVAVEETLLIVLSVGNDLEPGIANPFANPAIRQLDNCGDFLRFRSRHQIRPFVHQCQDATGFQSQYRNPAFDAPGNSRQLG